YDDIIALKSLVVNRPDADYRKRATSRTGHLGDDRRRRGALPQEARRAASGAFGASEAPQPHVSPIARGRHERRVAPPTRRRPGGPRSPVRLRERFAPHHALPISGAA